MPTIVVAIMARDEQDNIAACVKAAVEAIQKVNIDPIILLVDTGSRDETIETFAAECDSSNVDYHFVEHDWRDFAWNRSLTLETARQCSKGLGYTLMLDADDRLFSFDSSLGQHDAYSVTMRLGDTQFQRVQIFSNKRSWKYRSVVHEFPFLNEPHRIGTVNTEVIAGVSGKRAQDPLKYIHDADIIAKAILTETDPIMCARYYFYLAQSYRDAQHLGAAIFWYNKVMDNATNWSEERYIAALNLGRLDHPRHFLSAININPDRAEAWRAIGDNARADMCVLNRDWLFVETKAYKAQ